MRDYLVDEFNIPGERYVLFVVNAKPQSLMIRGRFDLRDRAVQEMRAWCTEQFGPKIDDPDADFTSGWYVPDEDSVFSFSDDRLEWASAFKLRWM